MSEQMIKVKLKEAFKRIEAIDTCLCSMKEELEFSQIELDAVKFALQDIEKELFGKKEKIPSGSRVLDVESVNQQIEKKDEKAVKKVDTKKSYTKEKE